MMKMGRYGWIMIFFATGRVGDHGNEDNEKVRFYLKRKWNAVQEKTSNSKFLSKESESEKFYRSRFHLLVEYNFEEMETTL